MSDNPFGGEPDPESARYEADREALMLLLSQFAEERDTDDGIVSALLLEAAVAMRCSDYVMSVAKPSTAGLRLELDRFLRDFSELIRINKKEAAGILAKLESILDELADDTRADE